MVEDTRKNPKCIYCKTETSESFVWLTKNECVCLSCYKNMNENSPGCVIEQLRLQIELMKNSENCAKAAGCHRQFAVGCKRCQIWQLKN